MAEAVKLRLPARSPTAPRERIADSEIERNTDGRIINGRRTYLRDTSLDEILKGNHATLEGLCHAVYIRFKNGAEIGPTSESQNTYTFEVIAAQCRRDWENRDKLRERFIGRKPVQNFEPYYEDKSRSKNDAVAELQEKGRDFLLYPRHMALIIAAGLGKTTEITRIFSTQAGDEKVVHFYASDHRNAEALKNLIEKHDRKAKVIFGRNESNCQRSEIVQEVARKNLPVQRMCCNSGSNTEDESTVADASFFKPFKCPFFDTCEYQKQFTDDDTRFLIFTKQHLTIKRMKGLPAPDLVVIDERFHDQLVETKSGRLSEVHLAGDVGHGRVITRALLDGEPLLKALRDAGVAPDQLALAADAEFAQWISDCTGRLRPGDDDATAKRQLRWLTPLSIRHYVLRELARELEVADRDHSQAVVLREGEVIVRFRKELMPKAPTLVLDATGDETILGSIFPGIEVHKIAVKRNTTVTQVVDTRLSKYSITDGRDAAARLAKVQLIINRLGREHSRGVVVTYKIIEDSLIVPEGWTITHFGAIRGRDDFKDYDAVVVTGNWTPPVHAVEDQAAALAGSRTLNLPGDWAEEERGYRGVNLAVRVRCHPDPLADALLKQQREAEATQAIDRLRLIHRSTPGHVYILDNLPLDIDIDHAVTLDDLANGGTVMGRLLSRFGGVVPLSSKFLTERAPDLFSTGKAAKRWIEKSYGPQQLYGSYSCWGPYPSLIEGTYRAKGQRGPNPTRFLATTTEFEEALTALVGPLADCDVPIVQVGSVTLTMKGRWIGAVPKSLAAE